ncbi:MAG: radical SAM protein [Bdellovibrionales bacterium]|nr:radical SAM protein [Bdellovibrionales bacterium]
MKILLINPPANQAHLRGNYCSNVSKGIYYYPAIDLLVQSGILHGAFDIQVLDAIATPKTSKEIFQYIAKESFDGVYAVTGSSSRTEDLVFFSELKQNFPNIRLLVSGGYLLTQYASTLRDHSYIDGVLLDWTSLESVDFFKGRNQDFKHIATKGHFPSCDKSEAAKVISYPTPRHEMFPIKKYHHPQAVHHPISVIIQSTGCPYRCSYCIYSITPYKYRPLEEVITEIEYAKSQGIRSLFFHDPTFGIDRNYTLEFCKTMTEKQIAMGWFCQSRVDRMDFSLLRAMKNAGCHGIMFGVETSDETLLREHERTIKHHQTIEIFRACKQLGIRTLSYLVIGLPGDSRESIYNTVELVKTLKSDFVSFNLAIPVIGTKFRDQLIAEGFISEQVLEFDNSSANPAMPTRHLTKDELFDIHKQSIKRFYMRPSYLLGRFLSIRSIYELKNHLREGLTLLKGLV